MVAPDLAQNVYRVIKYGVLFGLTLSMIVLFIGSMLVHDTYYIIKNPKFFISETLVMGILSALPVIYISWLRKAPAAHTATEFIVLFLKIAFIHIGFQLSGVYSILFPNSSDLEKNL